MFKKAKIEYLPKMNFRYRLLKVENEWYLMEVDRPIIITYFLLSSFTRQSFSDRGLFIFYFPST